MDLPQLLVLGVLLLALAGFVLDRWRYDLVAMGALLAVAVLGLVPAEEVFAGFGHPAVITVAAILVIGHGLVRAGVVDVLAAPLGSLTDRPVVQMVALTFVVTIASGFMNNVGAIAILMPVALRLGAKGGVHPGKVLMPMAFGSLLGGGLTLIGTPPNIILSAFRAESEGARFGMFDFLPVGGPLAVAGLVFMWLASSRLVPQREGGDTVAAAFRLDEYLTEVRVSEGSRLVGAMLSELEELVDADVATLAVLRGKRRIPAPPAQHLLREGDVLLVEVAPEALSELLAKGGLELVGAEQATKDATSDDVAIVEAVVDARSPLLGRTASALGLRRAYGTNLLAISRSGQRLTNRLAKVQVAAGDVLLLQGNTADLPGVLDRLGCLPLAQRELRLGAPRRTALAASLFVAAIVLSATGLLDVSVAFVAAAGAMVLTGLIPMRELYDRIDWPIVVLLAAMIPVGTAFELTGAAATVAEAVVWAGERLAPAMTVGLMLAGTMALSNVINNAAAAVLMAPVAIAVARGMEVSSDPFLMSVAIGASLPFLTPIGHQSNVLVMGPGGYQFRDYWKLGLPLSILVILLAVPLIQWFWPLGS